MPTDNPFSALLNPDKQGTISGFVGGLMGNPTASQAAGSATGDALSSLAALRSQGQTPQQSLISFLQTPQGQEYFTSAGPDGLKSLTDGLTSMTPPPPTMHNVPQGGQLYSQDANSGKISLQASNPKEDNTPADVKSFQYFASLGKVPPEEIQRLAALKADPANTSVASQAWDELGDKYGVDPRTVQAGKAGAIKMVPIKDLNGNDTGAVSLIDLSNPNAGAQIIRPSAPATPGTAPMTAPAAGTTPGSGAATGVLPATTTPANPSATAGNPAFGSKDDMALGAGPVSKVLGAATKLTEAISPSLIIDAGAQANDRKTLLDTLRSNLQSIGTIGGGMSSNKGLIDGYVKTYLDEGFFDGSPHSQVQKLIRLRENAEKNISEEQARMSTTKDTTPDVRKQSAETVAGWQRVLSSMPDYDTLIKQEAAIKNGTAGAPTVEGAVKDLAGAASKSLTEVKKQGVGVSKTLGVNGQPVVDIDSINDPAALAAIDPRGLDRAGKIKYLRKVDQLTKRR